MNYQVKDSKVTKWMDKQMRNELARSHLPPTPTRTIRKAREIGLKVGLRYVYQGNIPGEGENTYCYNFGELLIERYNYGIAKNRIVELACPDCDSEIDGVWT